MWACERFRDYLIDLHFKIETDHKPLVPLLTSKNLDEMPLRIQRFKMRMMQFDYSVTHVAGKDLNTADTLSRLPSPKLDSAAVEFEKEVNAYVNALVTGLSATDERLEQIQHEQDKDEVCKKVKEFCQSSWPNLGTN